jgi:hypothetical protein
MGAALRPNRVQARVCRQAIAEVLGDETAAAILRQAAITDLPESLPAAPRDLSALSKELQPFVDLYRALLSRTNRETALSIVRRAIVHSGAVSHAHAAAAPRAAAEEGLSLTSPPPPGFRSTPEELERGFAMAMDFFSCEGRLLAYTPEVVRFHVTDCNWCRAMEQAGAPELIEFFCETDERFMDHHPTHRLELPTTIGRGGSHCDFRFVPQRGRKHEALRET